MAAAKKTFISELEDPNLMFISSADQNHGQAAELPAAVSRKEKVLQDADGIQYKNNPLYIEKRTARLQLVLQPSLVKRIKAEAARREVSVNELIHTLLDEIIPK